MCASACWAQDTVSTESPPGDAPAAVSSAAVEGSGGAAAADGKQPDAFPELVIPAQASIEQLDALLTQAKAAQPRNPHQYQAMQTAIRDASKQVMTLLAGQENTPRYQQAELDTIASSVALMTYFGEDAKQKTLRQVHEFLKSRKQLSLQDIQTGLLAAAMLELQPDKQPARDTYGLLNELLEEDEREEMQSLRLNLEASIRRLDLLGNQLELDAQALDGTRITTAGLAGKFVIVDFFATWCEPCLADVPRLQKHFQKYQSKGLAVVGISLDEDVQALREYLKRAELPWPIIHDNHEDPLQRLQMQFGISHLPTVLLLNKEGTVVSLEARGTELDRLLEMLFEAPTPAAVPPNSPAPAPPEEKTQSRLEQATAT